MGQPKFIAVLSTVAAALVGTLTIGVPTHLIAVEMTAAQQGKKIVFNRKKGNCLACHQMKGATMPGDWGPPLINMKERFPDKKKLRAQIWDPTIRNPDTPMPPFGRHQILSEDEITKVVEFIYSL